MTARDHIIDTLAATPNGWTSLYPIPEPTRQRLMNVIVLRRVTGDIVETLIVNFTRVGAIVRVNYTVDDRDDTLEFAVWMHEHPGKLGVVRTIMSDNTYAQRVAADQQGSPA